MIISNLMGSILNNYHGRQFGLLLANICLLILLLCKSDASRFFDNLLPFKSSEKGYMGHFFVAAESDTLAPAHVLRSKASYHKYSEPSTRENADNMPLSQQELEAIRGIISSLRNSPRPRLIAAASGQAIDLEKDAEFAQLDLEETSYNGAMRSQLCTAGYVKPGLKPCTFSKATPFVDGKVPDVIKKMNENICQAESAITETEVPFTKHCRFLGYSNVFVIDLSGDKLSEETMEAYLGTLWRQNLYVWLFEVDAQVSMDRGEATAAQSDSYSNPVSHLKSLRNTNMEGLLEPCEDQSTCSPSLGLSSLISSMLSTIDESVVKPAKDIAAKAISSITWPEGISGFIAPYTIVDGSSDVTTRHTQEVMDSEGRGLGSFYSYLLSILLSLNAGDSATNDSAVKPTAEYPVFIPNDHYFSKQWGLRNSEYPTIDIRAAEAWKCVENFRRDAVVVAHVDTGVDVLHPDLKQNIWTNFREIPNNGIDDDGNGYVDDVHGWNFAENNNDLSDSTGHGSHTAGILGAAINNLNGISGTAPNIKIMPLKIYSRASEIIEAIEYSLAQNVHISTNSWGFTIESKALRAVMDKAAYQDQLFVCAVDNRGRDNTYASDYPSNWGYGSGQRRPLPNLVRVAAMAEDGSLSPTSNYGGGNVDIAAPGVNILSTVPTNLSGSSYAYKSGTSMATPFVAGVAAILASLTSLTGTQLRHYLLESAREISALNGLVVTGGAVDAVEAVNALLKDLQQPQCSKTS